MIALLGREQHSVCGVRDYCEHLAVALAHRGVPLTLQHIAWPRRTWLRAFYDLLARPGGWRDERVLLQYTALSWSRFGVPLPFVVVALLLRLCGADLTVIFHDSLPHPGSLLRTRIRRRGQVAAMRTAYRIAARSVLTIPLRSAWWLPNVKKAVTIPVGSNVAPSEWLGPAGRLPPMEPVVAVFSVTPGKGAAHELHHIAQSIDIARASIAGVRVVFFGGGTGEIAKLIASRMTGVPTEILGIIAPDRAHDVMLKARAALFVRGPITGGRTTAIAAIAAGTPLVGYAGNETGHPVTEAGVRLVSEGRAELLGKELTEVLCNNELWTELHRRSRAAVVSHFSWRAIANSLLEALEPSVAIRQRP